MDRLSWGIIGAGGIARQFARGVEHSRTGKLVAIGSRTREGADRFASEHPLEHRHTSYEALLADPDVQAVYIAVPHPMHAEWAVKAAEAGKHILCEKPIGLNHAEAMAIVQAAREHDVFLMEAFMYRCHPQTARLVELVRSGAIGEVRHIQAAFGFRAEFNPEGRLFKNALGGGGILDVGCYPVSLSRLIAGAALGKDFADPIEVKAVGKLQETTSVDEHAVCVVRFPGSILASLATATTVNLDNTVRIQGTRGSILVESPWIPSRESGTTKIIVRRDGQEKPEEILIQTSEWIYGIEADTVAANIDRRQAPSPAMGWDDTLGNMRTLDQWRESFGFQYESEKLDKVWPTVSHRPLAVRKPNPMRYGKIPGVSKQVSRLIMGVDNQRAIAHGSVMFDAFFERGGTTFDSAYVYGGGICEQVLGRWVRNRGIRESVVIVDKGAHTPFCTPKDLTRQLHENLERLGTDYIDLYLMHRDNLEVPVGEFVDVLNEHLRAGRMRAFGGSNWSIQRLEEANAYARRKKLTGFSALSNNLSLARMVDPVWADCLHVSDKASREWLRKTQTVELSWSSQARGFFTDRASPGDRSDAELVRCWYADDNFQRKARARELAAKRNVPEIVIALAYVLCQPFPTFALIGPRSLSELVQSMQGLDVQLSQAELDWLWGED